MNRIVHIYTDHGPISILLVALKGAMVVFGIVILAQAFFRGEVGQVRGSGWCWFWAAQSLAAMISSNCSTARRN